MNDDTHSFEITIASNQITHIGTKTTVNVLMYDTLSSVILTQSTRRHSWLYKSEETSYLSTESFIEYTTKKHFFGYSVIYNYRETPHNTRRGYYLTEYAIHNIKISHKEVQSHSHTEESTKISENRKNAFKSNRNQKMTMAD